MTFPQPTPPRDPNKKKPISTVSVIIWCIVGGVGLYYIVTGLSGVIANG